MRFSLKQTSQRSRQGFTLVEMLVIAPIVIIVVTGLVAAMVAMVGDALAANSRAASAYDMQDALDRVEQDVRTTINFMGMFNYLESPQGRDGDTAAFNSSSNGDLILTQQATTKNPYDSTRKLVYYADQPANCAGDITTNRTLKVRTVYFLRNGSLWRRVLVDTWNTNSPSDLDTVCNAPWQRDTCPVGSTMGAAPAATCNTADEELLQNVTEFTPTFYTEGTTTTSNPLLASSVSIKITTSKSVGGETITQTSTIRAARRNDVPVSTTIPSTPTFSQYNPDINVYNNSITVSIQWNADSAYSYQVQTSSDDGTTWSSPYLTAQNWASVSVPYGGMPARVRVTAYNDAGASSQATSSQILSPVWTYVDNLQNGWENYGDASNTYSRAAWTVNAAGMVMLTGLVKNGTVNTLLFSLPSSLAPEYFISPPIGSGGRLARAYVHQNGNVYIVSAAVPTDYVSLSGISFLPKDRYPTYTGTLGTWNQWTNYNTSTYGPPRYAVDGAGRVHTTAMVTGSSGTPGNNCSGCDYFQVPVELAPTKSMILPAYTNGNAFNTTLVNYNQPGPPAVTAIESRAFGVATGWNNIYARWYPNTPSRTWYNLTMNGTWVNYGGTAYNTAQCTVSTVDGTVMIRGLIKSGNAASGQVVAKLPANCPVPSKRWVFMVVGIKSGGSLADQTPVVAQVYQNGDILIRHDGNASNLWLSLEGILYSTQPQ